MNFVTFLWNIFARIVGIFGSILIEICIFGLIYIAIKPSVGALWLDLFTYIFIIWIIVDTILKIFIGGSASILRYLWSFTQ